MKESVASERYNYLHLHVDLLNDPPGSPELPLLLSACPSAIHMNVFFFARSRLPDLWRTPVLLGQTIATAVRKSCDPRPDTCRPYTLPLALERMRPTARSTCDRP